eukprot:3298110-Amphidinium_carterae.1
MFVDVLLGLDPGDLPTLLQGVHAYEMEEEQGNVLFPYNSVLFTCTLQMPFREVSWEVTSVGSTYNSSPMVGTLAHGCDVIMRSSIIVSPMSDSWLLRQLCVSHRVVGTISIGSVATGSEIEDVTDTMSASLEGSPVGVKNEKSEAVEGIKNEGREEVPHLSETESVGHPREEEPAFGSGSESGAKTCGVREEHDEDSTRNPVGELDVKRVPIQPLKKPSWAVDSVAGVFCKTTQKRVYPPEHPPSSGQYVEQDGYKWRYRPQRGGWELCGFFGPKVGKGHVPLPPPPPPPPPASSGCNYRAPTPKGAAASGTRAEDGPKRAAPLRPASSGSQVPLPTHSSRVHESSSGRHHRRAAAATATAESDDGAHASITHGRGALREELAPRRHGSRKDDVAHDTRDRHRTTSREDVVARGHHPSRVFGTSHRSRDRSRTTSREDVVAQRRTAHGTSARKRTASDANTPRVASTRSRHARREEEDEDEPDARMRQRRGLHASAHTSSTLAGHPPWLDFDVVTFLEQVCDIDRSWCRDQGIALPEDLEYMDPRVFRGLSMVQRGKLERWSAAFEVALGRYWKKGALCVMEVCAETYRESRGEEILPCIGNAQSQLEGEIHGQVSTLCSCMHNRGLLIGLPRFTGGGGGRSSSRTGDNKSIEQNVGRLYQYAKEAAPQYTALQLKTLIRQSDKVMKSLQEPQSRNTRLDTINREAERLGLRPKLGVSEGDDQDNGWNLVKKRQSRAKSRTPVSDEHTPTLQVAEKQFVHDGVYIPTRGQLLPGESGVVLVRDQEHFTHICMQSSLLSSSQPQVLVCAKGYKLPVGVQLPEPQVLPLRFRAGEKDIDGHAHIYHVSNCAKPAAVVSPASEIKVGLAATFVVRLELARSLMQGRGYWLPRVVTPNSMRDYLRDVLGPDRAGLLRSLWQPKALADSGQILARVLATDWHQVLLACLDAGLAATPGRATQLHTTVVWLPKGVECREEAGMMADELLERCPKQVVVKLDEGGEYTWSRDSALFIKMAGRKPTFGVRVPLEHSKDVMRAAGKDARPKYLLRNCLASWQGADIVSILTAVQWTGAEPDKPLAGGRVWQIRAETPPPRWSLLVNAGYQRTTLTVEEAGLRKMPDGPKLGHHGTSWQQLAKTTQSSATRARSEPPAPTAKFAGVDVGPSSSGWPARRRHSPGPGVTFAQPMEDDGDWDCPGLTWEEGAMTDEWEEDCFEGDLEDDIGDSWCEREPPNKRGRDAQEDHSRQASADALRDLKEENQQLRAQLTQLMSRMEAMCSRMGEQQAAQQAPPLPLPMGGPAQISAPAGALPSQPLEQGWPAHRNSPVLTHDNALVGVEAPVTHDEVEQVSTSLYQITPQGECIFFPEWENRPRLDGGALCEVYRLPWHLTKREARAMQWRRVSGEGNLCWWRSLQVHLARHGRAVNDNPQELKTAVLEWSLQNAALLAQSYNTSVEEIRRQVQGMRQPGALSTDLALFASSIYYQTPVV